MLPQPVAVLTRARSGSGDPGSPAARSVKLCEIKGHRLEKHKMVSRLVPQIYSPASQALVVSPIAIVFLKHTPS